jgi:hypothetical protein
LTEQRSVFAIEKKMGMAFALRLQITDRNDDFGCRARRYDRGGKRSRNHDQSEPPSHRAGLPKAAAFVNHGRPGASSGRGFTQCVSSRGWRSAPRDLAPAMDGSFDRGCRNFHMRGSSSGGRRTRNDMTRLFVITYHPLSELLAEELGFLGGGSSACA